MPAKYVIHTVGPMGINKEALTSCYKTCLKIMEELKLTSIAFPCISTGKVVEGEAVVSEMVLKKVNLS